jgi:hypothetical protein
MKEVVLALPQFAFVIGTRVALGVGIGLLVSEKLPASDRRRIGTALVAIGAASTVAALRFVRRSLRSSPQLVASVEQDDRLIGAMRFARRGDDEY